MADIFDVLADSTRRDILISLLEHEPREPGAGSTEVTVGMSVTQLVAALAISQPTVSKHLKVLRDAGLVTVREEGQHRFYRLDRGPLEELEDWLVPFTAADAATDAVTLAGIALNDEQRAFALAIGKKFADVTKVVTKRR